jgi:hypothetical protein
MADIVAKAADGPMEPGALRDHSWIFVEKPFPFGKSDARVDCRQTPQQRQIEKLS